MADEKPEPGAGDVALELDGKQVVLRPTLEACMALSRGGLHRMRERVANLDFEAITEVIAVGLGVNPAQKQRLVAPAVYKAGMIQLSAPCILFLHAIANGGAVPQVNSTGQTLDALDEVIAYVSGNDQLTGELEALAEVRAKLAEIFQIETAEAQETDDPLPESGSPSANSTDD